MRLHHFSGYAYGITDIVLMTWMLSRLWSYQIEFPARTLAHLRWACTQCHGLKNEERKSPTSLDGARPCRPHKILENNAPVFRHWILKYIRA